MSELSNNNSKFASSKENSYYIYIDKNAIKNSQSKPENKKFKDILKEYLKELNEDFE